MSNIIGIDVSKASLNDANLLTRYRLLTRNLIACAPVANICGILAIWCLFYLYSVNYSNQELRTVGSPRSAALHDLVILTALSSTKRPLKR